MRCERFWHQPYGWLDSLGPDEQAMALADFRLCEEEDHAEQMAALKAAEEARKKQRAR
jgi:hypothetical protein